MTATRLRFVDGAWLLAADLRDAPRLPSERLAQHHIAAHHTWGVAGGLRAGLDGRHAVVEPGAAVDRCGRIGILSRPARVRVPSGAAVVVVLTVVGEGPRGAVRWREPGRLHDLDVPLATIDGLGAVHAGDTHRRWLRRPGPTITLAGTVAKGAPVTAIDDSQDVGRTTGWRTSVDLSAHRLPEIPTVVAGLAGAPVRTARHELADRGIRQVTVEDTTVEVADVAATGFDLIVRAFVAAVPAATSGAVPARVRTAPFALTWLAVLPAERPEFPPIEE